ncbi:hypothetical protein GLAREA_11041 [Glarea lozoyensis ATCC 20868]|nr:uncharacterized protein GLAREA_11041 [Glarea lozoyensis ATCC 20868]EPE35342.1 hypothetical protein GLAREA_11041 [Glarea lozoyensis ATCC 20868]
MSPLRGILKKPEQNDDECLADSLYGAHLPLELPMIPVMLLPGDTNLNHFFGLVGWVRCSYESLDYESRKSVPEVVRKRLLSAKNWSGRLLKKNADDIPCDTRDTRVRWTDEVVFNERPRRDRSRALSLNVENVTVLKAVSLPLECGEVPSVLRQEIDIICNTSSKTCVAENVFIKIGLDEDTYWNLKDKRDKLDSETNSVDQEAEEDEDTDEEAEEKGPWEGTPICDSDDEDLELQPEYPTSINDCDIYDAQEYSESECDSDAGLWYLESSPSSEVDSGDGLWQPGDPVSDDSDEYSSEEDGIYNDIPVNGSKKEEEHQLHPVAPYD